MLAIACGMFACKSRQTAPQETVSPLTTEKDSASYALGAEVARRDFLEKIDTVQFSRASFAKGVSDVLNGDSTLLNKEEGDLVLQTYSEKLQELERKKQELYVEENRLFLEGNKSNPGVVALPSGLQYKVLKEGAGEKPGPKDRVLVHYHGTMIDGTVFDSSVERGQPITLGVGQVIMGWQEALQLMPVGSKWELYIPQELGYGGRQAGKIKPYSTLIFQVELLEIVK